ncbi:MAG: hypothetical protein J6D36_01110, partial [Erysipelotrichaceae bacterium]|nr:hypothetical protein [Erysipelotrichaceae bacterium]
AAYPFMFSSKKVFAGTILAATISGIAVGALGVKGTAYIPAFMAPFMANPNHAVQTVICIVIAIGTSCLFTVLANLSDMGKPKN